jgi:hypothetical protein
MSELDLRRRLIWTALNEEERELIRYLISTGKKDCRNRCPYVHVFYDLYGDTVDEDDYGCPFDNCLFETKDFWELK